MNVLKTKVQSDFDRISQLSYDEGWNHNSHYHGFLLKQVPSRCEEALEVGCGTGAFTRLLAEGADRVMAFDLSPGMIQIAQTRSRRHTNIDYQVADATTWEYPVERFDTIASIATLHHLPIEKTLVRMKRALKVGGSLLILDLYEPTGVRDKLTGTAAVPVSFLLKMLRNGRLREPREVREAWADHGRSDVYPTLAQVRQICASTLPGAQVWRHLLWRYSIVWRKRD